MITRRKLAFTVASLTVALILVVLWMRGLVREPPIIGLFAYEDSCHLATGESGRQDDDTQREEVPMLDKTGMNEQNVEDLFAKPSERISITASTGPNLGADAASSTALDFFMEFFKPDKISLSINPKVNVSQERGCLFMEIFADRSLNIDNTSSAQEIRGFATAEAMPSKFAKMSSGFRASGYYLPDPVRNSAVYVGTTYRDLRNPFLPGTLQWRMIFEGNVDLAVGRRALRLVFNDDFPNSYSWDVTYFAGRGFTMTYDSKKLQLSEGWSNSENPTAFGPSDMLVGTAEENDFLLTLEAARQRSLDFAFEMIMMLVSALFGFSIEIGRAHV